MASSGSKSLIHMKQIIILVIFALPVVTANVDCEGKAFHCVNLTHFKICVDLGGGVSKTIDSFIIPCPVSTECRKTNRYECEFPKPVSLETVVITSAPDTHEVDTVTAPVTTESTDSSGSSTTVSLQSITGNVSEADVITTTTDINLVDNTVRHKATFENSEPGTNNYTQPSKNTTETIKNKTDTVEVPLDINVNDTAEFPQGPIDFTIPVISEISNNSYDGSFTNKSKFLKESDVQSEVVEITAPITTEIFQNMKDKSVFNSTDIFEISNETTNSLSVNMENKSTIEASVITTTEFPQSSKRTSLPSKTEKSKMLSTVTSVKNESEFSLNLSDTIPTEAEIFEVKTTVPSDLDLTQSSNRVIVNKKLQNSTDGNVINETDPLKPPTDSKILDKAFQGLNGINVTVKSEKLQTTETALSKDKELQITEHTKVINELSPNEPLQELFKNSTNTTTSKKPDTFLIVTDVHNTGEVLLESDTIGPIVATEEFQTSTDTNKLNKTNFAETTKFRDFRVLNQSYILQGPESTAVPIASEPFSSSTDVFKKTKSTKNLTNLLQDLDEISSTVPSTEILQNTTVEIVFNKSLSENVSDLGVYSKTDGFQEESATSSPITTNFNETELFVILPSSSDLNKTEIYSTTSASTQVLKNNTPIQNETKKYITDYLELPQVSFGTASKDDASTAINNTLNITKLDTELAKTNLSTSTESILNSTEFLDSTSVTFSTVGEDLLSVTDPSIVTIQQTDIEEQIKLSTLTSITNTGTASVTEGTDSNSELFQNAKRKGEDSFIKLPLDSNISVTPADDSLNNLSEKKMTHNYSDLLFHNKSLNSAIENDVLINSVTDQTVTDTLASSKGSIDSTTYDTTENHFTTLPSQDLIQNIDTFSVTTFAGLTSPESIKEYPYYHNELEDNYVVTTENLGTSFSAFGSVTETSTYKTMVLKTATSDTINYSHNVEIDNNNTSTLNIKDSYNTSPFSNVSKENISNLITTESNDPPQESFRLSTNNSATIQNLETLVTSTKDELIMDATNVLPHELLINIQNDSVAIVKSDLNKSQLNVNISKIYSETTVTDAPVMNTSTINIQHEADDNNAVFTETTTQKLNIFQNILPPIKSLVKSSDATTEINRASATTSLKGRRKVMLQQPADLNEIQALSRSSSVKNGFDLMETNPAKVTTETTEDINKKILTDINTAETTTDINKFGATYSTNLEINPHISESNSDYSNFVSEMSKGQNYTSAINILGHLNSSKSHPGTTANNVSILNIISNNMQQKTGNNNTKITKASTERPNNLRSILPSIKSVITNYGETTEITPASAATILEEVVQLQQPADNQVRTADNSRTSIVTNGLSYFAETVPGNVIAETTVDIKQESIKELNTVETATDMNEFGTSYTTNLKSNFDIRDSNSDYIIAEMSTRQNYINNINILEPTLNISKSFPAPNVNNISAKNTKLNGTKNVTSGSNIEYTKTATEQPDIIQSMLSLIESQSSGITTDYSPVSVIAPTKGVVQTLSRNSSVINGYFAETVPVKFATETTEDINQDLNTVETATDINKFGVTYSTNLEINQHISESNSDYLSFVSETSKAQNYTSSVNILGPKLNISKSHQGTVNNVSSLNLISMQKDIDNNNTKLMKTAIERPYTLRSILPSTKFVEKKYGGTTEISPASAATTLKEVVQLQKPADRNEPPAPSETSSYMEGFVYEEKVPQNLITVKTVDIKPELIIESNTVENATGNKDLGVAISSKFETQSNVSKSFQIHSFGTSSLKNYTTDDISKVTVVERNKQLSTEKSTATISVPDTSLNTFNLSKNNNMIHKNNSYSNAHNATLLNYKPLSQSSFTEKNTQQTSFERVQPFNKVHGFLRGTSLNEKVSTSYDLKNDTNFSKTGDLVPSTDSVKVKTIETQSSTRVGTFLNSTVSNMELSVSINEYHGETQIKRDNGSKVWLPRPDPNETKQYTKQSLQSSEANDAFRELSEGMINTTANKNLGPNSKTNSTSLIDNVTKSNHSTSEKSLINSLSKTTKQNQLYEQQPINTNENISTLSETTQDRRVEGSFMLENDPTRSRGGVITPQNNSSVFEMEELVAESSKPRDVKIENESLINPKINHTSQFKVPMSYVFTVTSKQTLNISSNKTDVVENNLLKPPFLLSNITRDVEIPKSTNITIKKRVMDNTTEFGKTATSTYPEYTKEKKENTSFITKEDHNGALPTSKKSNVQVSRTSTIISDSRNDNNLTFSSDKNNSSSSVLVDKSNIMNSQINSSQVSSNSKSTKSSGVVQAAMKNDKILLNETHKTIGNERNNYSAAKVQITTTKNSKIWQTTSDEKINYTSQSTVPHTIIKKLSIGIVNKNQDSINVTDDRITNAKREATSKTDLNTNKTSIDSAVTKDFMNVTVSFTDENLKFNTVSGRLEENGTEIRPELLLTKALHEESIGQNNERNFTLGSVSRTNFTKQNVASDNTYKNNSVSTRINSKATVINIPQNNSVQAEAGKKEIVKNNTWHTSKNIISFDCRNRNRGRYSDPEDCNKFYVCIGKLNPIIRRCPVHTVFSDIKKQCTNNISHCIRQSEFKCAAAGRFSDLMKQNIYYICVKRNAHFIRYTFQCQNGYFLNKKSVKCNPLSHLDMKSQTSISTDNSKSEISISETIKVSKKTASKAQQSPKSGEDFECDEEGKFANDNDCRKYFVCTKTKKSEFRRRIKKCDSDELFHKNRKKCVDAESYEC